jgi:hypothetical protein
MYNVYGKIYFESGGEDMPASDEGGSEGGGSDEGSTPAS